MLDEMNQDMQKLKKDMADVRATERSIVGALVRIEGKLDGLLDEVSTKAQVGDLIQKIDDFSGLVMASRDERKISDESFSGIQRTLQDHEARLIRLEPKKS